MPHVPGYNAMSTNGHVVTDHDMAIDLGALADDRVTVAATVDDGVGPDFHIVLQHDAAQLHDLMVSAWRPWQNRIHPHQVAHRAG